MDKHEFVKIVCNQVYDSAVNSVLETCQQGPAGIAPHKRVVELSRWYSDLSQDDRARVEEIAKESAAAAVFGVLALLDGVRSYGPMFAEGGEYILLHRHEDTETHINEQRGEMLHDIFQSMIPPD